MNTGWIDFVILSKHLSEFLIHRAPHSVDNVTNDREKTFAKIFLDLNSNNQPESCKPLLDLVRFGKVINILSRFQQLPLAIIANNLPPSTYRIYFSYFERFRPCLFHYFRQRLKKASPHLTILQIYIFCI